LPTGLVVRCHDSRDQLVNRKLARKLLYEKLDLFVNGESSTVARREAKLGRAKERQRRRRLAKAEEGVQELPGKEDTQSEDELEDEELLAKYDEIKLDKIGKDIK
jgi:protein subunit release factor B